MMQYLLEFLLTYNLHILVCRLQKQEEAKGCVARCGELCVERGIQVTSNVKYKLTSCPDKLYAAVLQDLVVTRPFFDIAASCFGRDRSV